MIGDTPALVLGGLAAERPIFHSEADFQHAFAWHLHNLWPSAAVRLEYRPIPEEPRALDVWVTTDTERIAIELKYVTRRLSITLDGERFELANHSAQDQRRYDFWNDVQRVERAVEAADASEGWAIFLTNDSSYWRESVKAAAVDTAFRMHEGREVLGQLTWGSLASAGTMKGRAGTLALSGTYRLRWGEYSEAAPGVGGGTFRYLAASVTEGIGGGKVRQPARFELDKP